MINLDGIIGFRTNQELYAGSIGLLLLSSALLFAGWLHLQPKFRPSLSWFKNNESRLNHHLSGLMGVSSLAWTGHIVHVAIPASRGVHVGWDNFLTTPPHPAGLTPFYTGNWTVYAENPDTAGHIYGTSEGAGTAILTFLGSGDVPYHLTIMIEFEDGNHLRMLKLLYLLLLMYHKHDSHYLDFLHKLSNYLYKMELNQLDVVILFT